MNKNLLSLDALRKYLFENLYELDSEVVDATNSQDGNNDINQTPEEKPKISTADKLYDELSDNEKRTGDGLIEKALSTGTAAMTHQQASNKGDYKVFNYYTTKLATLYLESKNDKIKAALLASFPTHINKVSTKNLNKKISSLNNNHADEYGVPTTWLAMIGKKFGVLFSKGNYENEKLDYLMDGIIDAMNKVCDYFNPNAGVSFSYFYTLVITDRVKNTFKKLGNQVALKSSSLDAQVGNSDEDGMTFADTVSSDGDFETGYDPQTAMNSKENQEEKDNKLKAISETLDYILKNAKNENYFKVYELAREGLKNQQISEILGIPAGQVNAIKNKIMFLLGKNAKIIEQLIKNKFGYYVKLPIVMATDNNGVMSPKLAFLNNNYGKEDKNELSEMLIAKFDTTLNENVYYLNMAAIGFGDTEPNVLHGIEFLMEEINYKMESLNKVTTGVKNLIDNTTLNEQWGDGKDVAVRDFYQHIKEVVMEAINVIQVLNDQIHEMDAIAWSIKNEYPEVHKEIASALEPHLLSLLNMPKELNMMLHNVKLKYKPNDLKRMMGHG